MTLWNGPQKLVHCVRNTILKMPRSGSGSRSKQPTSSTQTVAVMDVNDDDDDMEYLQLGLEMSETLLKPQPLWPHSATVFDDERNKLRVVKTSESADGNTLEFDLINVDACFANAIRRVLLAEAPSMAFDVMKRRLNNTAISDECLASRLGLVPLRANPARFRYRTHARGYQHSRNETEQTPEDEDRHEFGNEAEETQTSLYFCLKKKHSYAASAGQSGDLQSSGNTLIVYSRDLEWVPVGNQKDTFTADQVGPIHPDIILHKFAVGHEVEVFLRAVKGIGKQHAKYQPVCTAWYRMLPMWTVKERIINEHVDKLCALMPLHAHQIFDISDEEKMEGRQRIRREVVGIKNARLSDNANRNYQQDAFLAQAVESGRNKRHFLFTIESVGSRSSAALTLDALDILIAKCDFHIELLKKH